MASALFACTKCHARHPFEDLSENEQICKSCRIANTAIKCTFCRSEFQNDDKSVPSALCKNCARLVKIHGKPRACEYCTQMAAFVGRKCQHCSCQEKKYGAPHPCSRCKTRCAFDRGPEYRKNMDGQLLCWLCIVSHKRAKLRASRLDPPSLPSHPPSLSSSRQQAPAPVVQDSGNLDDTPYSPESTPPVATTGGSEVKNRGSRGGSADSGASGGKDSAGGAEGRGAAVGDSNGGMAAGGSGSAARSRVVLKRKEASLGVAGVSGGVGGVVKRHRLDNSLTNGSSGSRGGGGVLGLVEGLGGAEPDYSGSDHVVAVTQMRETLEALKKQLQARDLTIIQKDQKITELKADHFEVEKQLRTRYQALQKESEATIEALQTKNRELQKKVLTFSKGSKKNHSGTPPV